MHPHLHGPRTLALIAGFKFLKSAALAALAIALLRLGHPGALDAVRDWLASFPITTGHRFVGHALVRLTGTSPHTMRLFAAVALLYATLYGIEGAGLWWNAKWAKYLTLVSTALFVPLELWEIFAHVTPLKLLALLINVLILVYLVWLLRMEAKHPAARSGRGR